jgi:hypothetical protein
LEAMTTGAGWSTGAGRTGARMWTPTIEAYRVVEIYVVCMYIWSSSSIPMAREP